MKPIITGLFIFALSFNAAAVDWITVSDMSQLKWQMNINGKVSFRNLDDFNSQALPCCYNYYIDTTTEGGKSLWSVVLAKIATSGELILGVDNIDQTGPIKYLGNW